MQASWDYCRKQDVNHKEQLNDIESHRDLLAARYEEEMQKVIEHIEIHGKKAILAIQSHRKNNIRKIKAVSDKNKAAMHYRQILLDFTKSNMESSERIKKLDMCIQKLEEEEQKVLSVSVNVSIPVYS